MDSFFLVASKRVQILGVSCQRDGQQNSTWPNLGGAFRPPGKEGRCTNDRFPSTGSGPRRCRSIPKKSGHPFPRGSTRGCPLTLSRRSRATDDGHVPLGRQEMQQRQEAPPQRRRGLLAAVRRRVWWCRPRQGGDVDVRAGGSFFRDR